jgi:hypothetical protein
LDASLTNQIVPLQCRPILAFQFNDGDPVSFGCAVAIVRLGFRWPSRLDASGGEGSNESISRLQAPGAPAGVPATYSFGHLKRFSAFLLSRPDWLKIKARPQQELVLSGFTEGKGSRKHLGALLLGAYRKQEASLFRSLVNRFSENAFANAID